MFTCSHCLTKLDQTLETEVGNMRRTPLSRGRVAVLLVAQPASCLLPGVVLELIQLHVRL